jgi:hypothetical protein
MSNYIILIITKYNLLNNQKPWTIEISIVHGFMVEANLNPPKYYYLILIKFIL